MCEFPPSLPAGYHDPLFYMDKSPILLSLFKTMVIRVAPSARRFNRAPEKLGGEKRPAGERRSHQNHLALRQRPAYPEIGPFRIFKQTKHHPPGGPPGRIRTPFGNADITPEKHLRAKRILRHRLLKKVMFLMPDQTACNKNLVCNGGSVFHGNLHALQIIQIPVCIKLLRTGDMPNRRLVSSRLPEHIQGLLVAEDDQRPPDMRQKVPEPARIGVLLQSGLSPQLKIGRHQRYRVLVVPFHFVVSSARHRASPEKGLLKKYLHGNRLPFRKYHL